jgi:hypothetical protein
LYYVRSTLDVGEAASKAGADAAISKDAPLPNIICSLRHSQDRGSSRVVFLDRKQYVG